MRASWRSVANAASTSGDARGLEQALDVDPGDALQRGGDALGGLEVERRRELGDLERAEHRPLAAGLGQARGDDRAAHRPRAVHVLAGERRERHAAAAERAEAAGHALGGVAAALVLAAVLGEADHHEPPAQLVAVAPVQHGEVRGRGPRPRAAGIGEVQDLDHLPNVSGDVPSAAPPSLLRPYDVPAGHRSSPGALSRAPILARPPARCAPGSRRRWRPSSATTAARSWPPRRPPRARRPSACAWRTGCSRRAASAASR